MTDSKLTDLIETVVKATGIEERSVRETARRLREANLITTGKKGRYGGADMSPRDAAALTIAIVGSGDNRSVAQSVDTVDLIYPLEIGRFRNRHGDEDVEAPAPEFFFGLSGNHTFGEAIEAILSHQELLPEPHYAVMRLDVSVERPWPRGKIKVWGSSFRYQAIYEHPATRIRKTAKKADESLARFRVLEKLFEAKGAGYSIERTLDHNYFDDVGLLFASDELIAAGTK